MISGRSADPLVADTGPLLALARIDALALPSRLFARVLVPARVAAECNARPDATDCIRVREAIGAGLLHVSPADEPAPPPSPGLGGGEHAVIEEAAARAAIALLDDKAARRAAHQRQVRVLGTVGLLRLAKARGLVPAVRPLLTALSASGYFLSPALVEAVLRAENE
jgi:predicted nucleic acid-binding protein